MSSFPHHTPQPSLGVERSIDGFVKILQLEGLIDADRAENISLRSGSIVEQMRREGGKSAGRWGYQELDPAEVIARMAFDDDNGDPIDEDRICEIFARHAGYPYIKLDPLKLDSKLVTESLTLPFARRHTVLPLGVKNDRLIVATDNPYDVSTLDQIRAISGREIEVRVSTRGDIQKILRDIFGFRSSVSRAARQFEAAPDLQNLEAFVRLKSGEEIEASDTHVVNAVEYLLRYAFEQRASDIHIEPHRTETVVRMRIDGVLHAVYRVPPQVHPPIVSRIKSMGRLDIAEKRRAQDGRIKTAHKGREVELRISTLPVAFGEKVVIRILDPQVLLRDLGEIGFFPKQIEIFRSFIYRPNGLILVTGPTGSGKTTTLYSGLKEIAGPEVNVTTVEDPIEMVVDVFNQVAANARVDLDFAGALRTILRQDPDVLMVGEIRDGETARMAVQAALTGHLVLSTVHTNDAAGGITRLQDLGVPNYLLSSTLLGLVAQRLVRRNCPKCKSRAYLTSVQCRELGIPLKGGSPPKLVIYEGNGCANCRETGYRGRTAVLEVLPVSATLREQIASGLPLQDLRRTAVAEGMMTLREAAIKKMAQGETTFDEVLRVTASGEGV